MGWEEGAKAVLRLHSASVGKDEEEEEEEEEKFLVWCHEAFDRCNWGVKACTHAHEKHDVCEKRQHMKAAEHLHRYCTASTAAGRDGEAKL